MKKSILTNSIRRKNLSDFERIKNNENNNFKIKHRQAINKVNSVNNFLNEMKNSNNNHDFTVHFNSKLNEIPLNLKDKKYLNKYNKRKTKNFEDDIKDKKEIIKEKKSIQNKNSITINSQFKKYKKSLKRYSNLNFDFLKSNKNVKTVNNINIDTNIKFIQVNDLKTFINEKSNSLFKFNSLNSNGNLSKKKGLINFKFGKKTYSLNNKKFFKKVNLDLKVKRKGIFMDLKKKKSLKFATLESFDEKKIIINNESSRIKFNKDQFKINMNRFRKYKTKNI